MQLDLRTLQMFHRMAREGVNSASSRLNNISTLNSEVAVTRIQFVAHDALNDEFQDEEHLGVSVDLGAEFPGNPLSCSMKMPLTVSPITSSLSLRGIWMTKRTIRRSAFRTRRYRSLGI